MTTQINRSPLGTALRACFPALGTTFVLSMFINASMLASPLYSMQIYDRVLTSRNVGTLTMLTLIVGMFLVLYGILEFARAGVLARAGVMFEGTLRHPLFETMMQAETSPRHRFGQQVIRDAETIRDCISNGTAAIACDLPWPPVCVGAYLAIDRQISPGAMMAASIIMGRALAPVEQVVGQWKRIVAFRSAYRRLEDLFHALPTTAAPTALPTPKGEIEVENAVVF